MERHQRGPVAPGRRSRRRHRVAVGTKGHRLHARGRAARAGPGEGRLMLGLGAHAAPVVVRGLPRLPWVWSATGAGVLLASCAIGVLVGPVHIGFGTVVRTLLGLS